MLPVTCLHPEMSPGAYFWYEIYTSVFAVYIETISVINIAVYCPAHSKPSQSYVVRPLVITMEGTFTVAIGALYMQLHV